MSAEATVISNDLAGIVVGDTAISDVQGERGLLSYRGIDINDLVGVPFLHVVWMVLFGDWPEEHEKSRLKTFMCRHTRLSHKEIELLRHVPRDLHPAPTAQALTAQALRLVVWWTEHPDLASREQVVDTLLRMHPGLSGRAADS